MSEREQGRLELSHLRREVKTALELAIVALAPWELVHHLASAAGLLEALAELPVDSPPPSAIMPKAVQHARGGLEAWQAWEKKRGKPSA